MGWKEDKDRRAEDEKDAIWFTDRMALLVEELKTMKDPQRAGYLRGCLNAAMKAHARCTQQGSTTPDDFEDR